MATKKQNRAHIKRRVRRVLNRVKDFFTHATGNKLHGRYYGAGVGRSDVRDTSLSEG